MKNSIWVRSIALILALILCASIAFAEGEGDDMAASIQDMKAAMDSMIRNMKEENREAPKADDPEESPNEGFGFEPEIEEPAKCPEDEYPEDEYPGDDYPEDEDPEYEDPEEYREDGGFGEQLAPDSEKDRKIGILLDKLKELLLGNPAMRELTDNMAPDELDALEGKINEALSKGGIDAQIDLNDAPVSEADEIVRTAKAEIDQVVKSAESEIRRIQPLSIEAIADQIRQKIPHRVKVTVVSGRGIQLSMSQPMNDKEFESICDHVIRFIKMKYNVKIDSYHFKSRWDIRIETRIIPPKVKNDLQRKTSAQIDGIAAEAKRNLHAIGADDNNRLNDLNLAADNAKNRIEHLY